MADRFDFFFRQKVTEQELDDAFAELEAADRNMMTDLDLLGVMQNAVVTEKSGTPNLTVDVSGSASIHDKVGQRITWGAIQNVDVSIDENAVSTAPGTPGNEKIVSVFAKFVRLQTDPRIDGNSLTVFFNQAESFEFVVRQGAETGSPPATPPPLDSEYILLADIQRTNPQVSILNANITGPTGTYAAITNRREDAFVVTVSGTTLRAGTPEEMAQALFTQLSGAGSTAFTPGAMWATVNDIVATDVQSAIDEVVSDLADQTAGVNNAGAYNIGLRVTETWASGDGITAQNIGAAFEELLGDLKVSSPTSGADRIGFNSNESQWTNAVNAITAGNVQDAIDEIVTDLAGQGVSGSNGASLVGANGYAGALHTLVDGSIESQLQQFADDALGVFALNDGASATPQHVGVNPTAPNEYAHRFGRIHTAWHHLCWDFFEHAVLADYSGAALGGAGGVTLTTQMRGIILVSTTAADNSFAQIEASRVRNDRSIGSSVFEYIVEPLHDTNVTIEMGFMDIGGVSVEANVTACMAVYDTDQGDSNWYLVGASGGATTRDDSGVAFTANTRYRITVAIAGDGSAEMWIDGVSVATLAAGVVGSGEMWWQTRWQTRTTSIRDLRLDRFEYWLEADK